MNDRGKQILGEGMRFLEDEIDKLGEGWKRALLPETENKYFKELSSFIEGEYEKGKIFPEKRNIFRAFRETEYEDLRVVVLGQDPYHNEGEADGLAFSVGRNVKRPPSLMNIIKEVTLEEADMYLLKNRNLYIESQNYDSVLLPWAEQGVLLLNAVLTVREGKAHSHKAKGWERFTDAVISHISKSNKNIVFILWGNYAREKRRLIDGSRHKIIEGVHPSPLSAPRGFFNKGYFLRCNNYLEGNGRGQIDWRV